MPGGDPGYQAAIMSIIGPPRGIGAQMRGHRPETHVRRGVRADVARRAFARKSGLRRG
ncbi:hypothetical protein BDI4_2030007 [Burkholderia diffusa]|nr:hypothetical protein BDI4_2030007 [Burkholderia diffusa]